MSNYVVKIIILILMISKDGVELMIIIIGTFGQVVSGQAHAVNIIAVIITWRGIVCSFYPSFVCTMSNIVVPADWYRNRW